MGPSDTTKVTKSQIVTATARPLEKGAILGRRSSRGGNFVEPRSDTRGAYPGRRGTNPVRGGSRTRSVDLLFGCVRLSGYAGDKATPTLSMNESVDP